METYDIYNNNGVILKALRLKSPDTYREQLRIYIFIDDEPGGSIICRISELEKDLMQLREYGTGLLRHEIVKIRSTIEHDYRKIPCLKLDEMESMDDTLKDIYDMFCVYIRDRKDEMEKSGLTEEKYYNIPVNEFNEQMQDCKYINYDSRTVRQRFEQLGLTKGNRGRTDRNLRIKTGDQSGKIIKVISFVKEKVDERLKQLHDEE